MGYILKSVIDSDEGTRNEEMELLTSLMDVHHAGADDGWGSYFVKQFVKYTHV